MGLPLPSTVPLFLLCERGEKAMEKKKEIQPERPAEAHKRGGLQAMACASACAWDWRREQPCSACGKNRTAAGRKSAYFQEIKEGQKAALFCFPTGMPRRHLRGDFGDRVGYQRRPLPCGKGLISVPAMEEKRISRCCRWKSIHGPCLRQTILPCHCSHR